MSGSALSDKIRDIIDNYNELSISEVKHRTSPLITDIRQSVDKELYDDFIVEFDCVKHECIYGDNDEDTEMVKYDLIKVLKKIIEVINVSS
jgi:hypothetical protein